jgi:hypothetical protein
MDFGKKEFEKYMMDTIQVGIGNSNPENNYLRELYKSIPENKAEEFRLKSIQLLGWTNRDFINKLSGFSMVSESEKFVINIISENL